MKLSETDCLGFINLLVLYKNSFKIFAIVFYVMNADISNIKISFVILFLLVSSVFSFEASYDLEKSDHWCFILLSRLKTFKSTLEVILPLNRKLNRWKWKKDRKVISCIEGF